MTIGFDLDGTLINSVDHPDHYSSNERLISSRLLPAAVYAGTFMDACVITGRTRRVRQATDFHTRVIWGQDMPVYDQDQWGGWDRLRDFKVDALLDAGCHTYVGDSSTDREAASLAGCRFIHVDDFVASFQPQSRTRQPLLGVL